MKFYICEHCGNIVTFLQSSGVPVMCCGQKMTELVPDSTDAAQEKLHHFRNDNFMWTGVFSQR